jgi:hypothetical protein
MAKVQKLVGNDLSPVREAPASSSRQRGAVPSADFVPLHAAQLIRTDLTGTDLTDARFGQTIFADVDLKRARVRLRPNACATPHRGPGIAAPSALCSLTTKRESGMTSPYRIERDRGTKEARQQLAVLREKWPLAFPVKHEDIRPLAMGVARQVAAAMGWSLPYTLGVLGGWKMAPVYCQAVLCHDQRIALDGSPAETIEAEAKDLAAKQLAKLAARKAAKKVAKPAAPAAVKPKPAPAPPTAPPEQLRDRVRAALLRRHA